MNKASILEKLALIFEDTFEDWDMRVTETLCFSEIAGWDSLVQINLVAAIEEAFGFRFKLEEIVELCNVQQIIDIIVKNEKS